MVIANKNYASLGNGPEIDKVRASLQSLGIKRVGVLVGDPLDPQWIVPAEREAEARAIIAKAVENRVRYAWGAGHGDGE
jgi:hypothetical protein